jgi:hypothetical protein
MRGNLNSEAGRRGARIFGLRAATHVVFGITSLVAASDHKIPSHLPVQSEAAI